MTVGLPRWQDGLEDSEDEADDGALGAMGEMPPPTEPLPVAPLLAEQPPIDHESARFSPPLLGRAYTAPPAYAREEAHGCMQGWAGWEGAAAGMCYGSPMVSFGLQSQWPPVDQVALPAESCLPGALSCPAPPCGPEDWAASLLILPSRDSSGGLSATPTRTRLSSERGDDGVLRIVWTKDERLLRATDREAVSPPFGVPMGDKEVQFKLILRPKKVADTHGGESFKRAKGKGMVLLRCVDDLEGLSLACSTLDFRIGVGSPEQARSAVRRDFSEKTIHGLPDAEDEWDLRAACEDGFFQVRLDVFLDS